MLNATNITPPRVPLTDPRTGMISREWYRFFLNLFTLTGSGTSSVTLEDLQVGPPTSPEVFEEINRIYNAALLNSPPVQLGTLSSVNQDNVAYLGFATSPSPDPADFTSKPVGTTWWDGGTTLSLQMTPDVTQKVGESQYFYVKAPNGVTKGQLVMFTGLIGDNTLLVEPATGVTDGQLLVGIAAETLGANDFGVVQSFGILKGVNTISFNQGEILYYDPSTPGGLQNSPPSAPNVKAAIAVVIKKAGIGGGEILIRMSPGSVLGGTDSNVQITTPAAGNLLQYDGTIWKNVAASAIGTVSSFSAGTTGFTPSTATTGAVTLAGTLGTANGGTNKSTAYNVNGVVYASATDTLTNSSYVTISSTGNVGIGSSATNVSLYLGADIGGVTNAFSLYNNATIQPSTTYAYYNQSAITLAVNATPTLAYAYNALQQALPSGASVGTQYGYAMGSVFTNGTTNYCFFVGNNAAVGTGKTSYSYYANTAIATGGGTTYNFYANGTAQNVFRGDTRFGSTVDPTATVDITGTLKVSSTVTFTTQLGTASGGTGLTGFTAANNAIYSTSASALTAGTLPIAAGGSGQTTAQAAMNAFAGATTSGYYLRGNGTNVVMAQLAAGDLTGQVAVANGGTGLSTIAADRVPYASALDTISTSANLTFNGTTLTTTKAQFNQASSSAITDYCARFTQSSGTTNAGRAIFDQNSTYAFAISVTGTGSTTPGCNLQWVTRSTGALLSTPLQINYNTSTTVGSVVFGGYTVNSTGATYEYQPAPTAKNAAATLTAAEVLTGILSYTGAAANVTLPTGTDLDAGANFATNSAILWSVINTGSGTCTIVVNTGITSLGTLTIAAAASGLFRIRRTAANTFVIYRLS